MHFFLQFCQMRLVIDQSSLVCPNSESRGSGLSMTKDEQTEILMSTFGCKVGGW